MAGRERFGKSAHSLYWCATGPNATQKSQTSLWRRVLAHQRKGRLLEIRRTVPITGRGGPLLGTTRTNSSYTPKLAGGVRRARKGPSIDDQTPTMQIGPVGQSPASTYMSMPIPSSAGGSMTGASEVRS